MRKLLNEELGRMDIDDFKGSSKLPVIIVLDNVRSSNNIGSVFRTSDAFRIQGLYLCGITPTPPHRDIHKTALGATDSVDWVYFENTLDAIAGLKEEGFRIIALEQVEGGSDLLSMNLSKNEKYAVILGHEIRGVEQEVVNTADIILEIPQYGTKHSLNVSVAAGIVIWEMFRQLGEML